MKRFAVATLLFVATSCFFMTSGCNVNPKPEVPASSYGKVVDKLPVLPEARERYSYPDYVELKHVH